MSQKYPNPKPVMGRPILVMPPKGAVSGRVEYPIPPGAGQQIPKTNKADLEHRAFLLEVEAGCWDNKARRARTKQEAQSHTKAAASARHRAAQFREEAV